MRKHSWRQRVAAVAFFATPATDAMPQIIDRAASLTDDHPFECHVLEEGDGATAGLGDIWAGQPIGEQRVVVLLANFQNSSSAPISPADAWAMIFDEDTPRSVQNYMLEVSDGQTWLVGDVRGWYTLAMNDPCGSTAGLAEQAVAAADSDVFFPDYDRLIVMVPRPPDGLCEYAFGGTAGRMTAYSSDGAQRMTVAHIRVGNYTAESIIHEIGHALGLGHANAWECGSQVFSGTCSRIMYGDFFDAMGRHAYRGHFNGFEKEKLGWLAEPDVQAVTQSGLYRLTPLEVVSSLPRSLKIARNDDTYFYIEFRRPIGNDDNWLLDRYGAGVYDGAMIRVNEFRQYINDYESFLLDMSPHDTSTPQANFDDWADVALREGQTFFDADTGAAITTFDVTDDFLDVCVILEPRGDFDASGHVDLYDFASLQNCFGLDWPLACECLIANFDGITSLDLMDYRGFLERFGA